ncbi:GNAT family N-acetyltransferase [Polluticaenibacter yanchengensis]|uniref:GNAT family N-acetyltransferase n=1 Tax=Polluticaenibacter yanchengensis TaxID=3014562 RepID=A0ABT4UJ35_9BACT|nr:GNAT family N-acetyltransferase [Chitinophagaceae bacterium LY-5]
MEVKFRKAEPADIPAIWEVLKGAIARRKADGSKQWQDGYPNPEVVKKDIDNGYGYVLTDDNDIAGYCAVMINDEPAYKDIIGKWITDGDFVVYHRVAISENHLGKGLAKKMMTSIEDFARGNNIKSLKVDTNFDNPAMLSILKKAGYVYCGEVVFRGSPRKAFEKVLD